jgi:glucose-1-phosphate thymidylyltransferase
MKGIILHGGHGTRLRPLTHTGPKQLLPIANKPMSQYCVESLKSAGITDIAIVIGGIGSKKVRDYYGDGTEFGINFTFIEQDSPKGIAHAISLCKDFIANEKFVVFLGDNLMAKSINEIAKKFNDSKIDAFLLLCEVDNPSQFGVAEIIDGKIKKIVEKPKLPISKFAVTGIYFFQPNIFDIFPLLKPSWRNELEIVDALQIMIDNDNKIEFDIITEFWKDTGTPNDIIRANKIILDNMKHSFFGSKENNVEINDNVTVGKNTIIKNGCKILGPAIIGDDCIIENNSIIGTNVSIGNNSRISNCYIEDSIVMQNCKINANIKIQDSIIAQNSEIFSQKNKQSVKKFLLGEGTKITL